jgi:hypothetical protein
MTKRRGADAKKVRSEAFKVKRFASHFFIFCFPEKIKKPEGSRPPSFQRSR